MRWAHVETSVWVVDIVWTPVQVRQSGGKAAAAVSWTLLRSCRSLCHTLTRALSWRARCSCRRHRIVSEWPQILNWPSWSEGIFFSDQQTPISPQHSGWAVRAPEWMRWIDGHLSLIDDQVTEDSFYDWVWTQINSISWKHAASHIRRGKQASSLWLDVVGVISRRLLSNVCAVRPDARRNERTRQHVGNSCQRKRRRERRRTGSWWWWLLW